MASNRVTHLIDRGASERSPLVRKHLTRQEFGRNLYRLMAAKRMTQSELARAADLPRDSISRYMRSISLPEPRNLEKLAKVFDMEPEDLLPNYQQQAIEMADDPPLEIKASPVDPTMSIVRIYRTIPTKALPKLLMALDEAEAS